VTERADPIPDELRQAFHEILWNFRSWRPPLPEIEVSINGTFRPMGAICHLVSMYSDALPTEAHDQLLTALRAPELHRPLHTEQPMLLGEIVHLLRSEREQLNTRELEAILCGECTYKTASFCLIKLIERQRARYLARTAPRP
jgi:hypothetical protein